MEMKNEETKTTSKDNELLLLQQGYSQKIAKEILKWYDPK